MIGEATSVQTIRILTPGAGDVTGDPAVCLDRYLIEARDSGALVALVEHTLAPGVLAAPMHRHSREDEYSHVLQGVLGVVQDDDEATAEAAAVVFKPRGHWHTFWNAGDETLRVLEIITPLGWKDFSEGSPSRVPTTIHRHVRRSPRSTDARSTLTGPCC